MIKQLQARLERHPKLLRLCETVQSALRIYSDNNADMAAAQLAYNLTLSLFPLVICLNAMLAGFDVTSRDVLEWGRGIIPPAALRLFGEYADYVSSQFSVTMLIGALILMLGAGATAFRCAVEICREVMGAEPRRGPMRFLMGFIFAIGFLIAIYFAIMVIVAGGVIAHLRYALLFLTLFVMIWGVYRVSAPGKRHVAGALLAAVALVLLGVIFSLTIEVSARYSLVYGSVTALIFLMLWLYLCGNVMIAGAIFNAKLSDRHKEGTT